MRKIGTPILALSYAAAIVLGIAVGVGTNHAFDAAPVSTAVTAMTAPVTTNLELN